MSSISDSLAIAKCRVTRNVCSSSFGVALHSFGTIEMSEQPYWVAIHEVSSHTNSEHAIPMEIMKWLHFKQYDVLSLDGLSPYKLMKYNGISPSESLKATFHQMRLKHERNLCP